MATEVSKVDGLLLDQHVLAVGEALNLSGRQRSVLKGFLYFLIQPEEACARMNAANGGS